MTAPVRGRAAIAACVRTRLSTLYTSSVTPAVHSCACRNNLFHKNGLLNPPQCNTKRVLSYTGCGSETSQLSPKSTSSSRSCLWGEASQPEEEDRDLERTLNSHGSTLLDIYPRMLNQIGEAYRRRHVTDAASAVLRRYHRRRWQSNRNHGSSTGYNRTPNRTRDESSLTAAISPHGNSTNRQKSTFQYQESSPHRSKMDFSPLKGVSNASLLSTACFYSPRRDDAEKRTGVEKESRWAEESPHRPVRVLDLSTPPSPVSSSPRSPSPDLNQTYVVEPVPLPRSHAVPTSSVGGSTWSPLKMARMASLASQGGSTLNSSPSYYRSSLRREPVHSPVASPQRALGGHLSQLRSPLKAKTISLEQNWPTPVSYPKQALPVIHTSDVSRSPYKAPRYPSPRQQFPHHRDNPSKQLKLQPSFSSHYSSSSNSPMSRMPSTQIDAQFMSLYHHFICRSTNPTTSCHLCKRRSGVQGPAVSSTSVSALSLTPVRSRLKKRHREPEVVESLRFKRFRESCSPRRTTQFWPKQQQQQQENGYLNTAMEDKYTWNRALLLQCPSPGFLRAIRRHQTSASGSNGKGPGSKHCSPSWVRRRVTRQNILHHPMFVFVVTIFFF